LVSIKGLKLTKKTVKKTAKPDTTRNKFIAPLFFVGGYFKGSWAELKKVTWPNRKATWGLTAAVIIFTALFVALIMLLDAMFSQLFKLIIK